MRGPRRRLLWQGRPGRGEGIGTSRGGDVGLPGGANCSFVGERTSARGEEGGDTGYALEEECCCGGPVFKGRGGKPSGPFEKNLAAQP